jgi:ubiquinone biosynthesis protein COQ4
MAAHPAGRGLLASKATIDTRSVDFAALATLPEGTLGREYQGFLAARGLEPFGPSEIMPASADIAWLSTRMRQAHDVWHVVTGYDSDVAGELELQAFSYAQTDTPFSLLITVLGTLKARFKSEDRDLQATISARVMAAYRRGRRAADFVPVAWEELWTRPLAEVRQLMGV